MRRLLTRWWFWALAAPGMLVLCYLALVLVFVLGRPSIRRNISHELNERALALKPEERADTIYRQAAAAFPDMPESLLKTPTAWPSIYPGDPEWEDARAFLREAAPSLALVRRGAAIPKMGFLLTNVTDEGYQLGPSKRAKTPSAGIAEQNPQMLSVLLPHLGALRSWVRTFEFDARLALTENDAPRAHADLLTMLRLARHADEQPMLISRLVSQAIASLACKGIFESLQDSSGAFTNAPLAELDAALGQLPDFEDFSHPLLGERAVVEDLLQRTYTDDGHGDGRLCYRGVRELENLTGSMNGAQAPKGNVFTHAFTIASGPLILLFDDSRRTISDRHKHLIDSIIAYAKEPPWTRAECPASQDAERTTSPLLMGRMILDILMPAFGKAVASEVTITTQVRAARAAIAIERHRLAHGSYPATLAEVVPAYLPAAPIDPFDGKPLRYMLVNGRPMLYSVGCDGKDDGGVPPPPDDTSTANTTSRSHVLNWRPPSTRGKCPSGDWVLWPVEREKREQPK